MIGPPPIILDSSVAIAIVRNEPGAAALRVAVDQWTILGRPLMVPAIFWLEGTGIAASTFFMRFTSWTN